MTSSFFFIWILFFTLVSSDTQKKQVENLKKHHTKNGFQNNYPIEKHGFGSFLKWQFGSSEKGKNRMIHYEVAENNPEWIRNNKEMPTVTWINHSTFLIQIDGLNILTDPIFSERCSPVQWAGPKRGTAPGLKIEDLPQIDYVFISHDHYDHLDKNSVLEISKRFKEHPPLWFVPLKVKNWFDDLNIPNVTEMDWWDSQLMDGLEGHCVPAQHFSGRGLTNRNGTLWAGWVFIKNEKRFFFAGDTGYSPDFKVIGEQLGPFDVSFIPIGAYSPRWFMSGVHVDPKQAVQIHQDVKSKFSVAMHWGTFALADEDMDEPPRLLEENLEKAGIPKDEFVALQNGKMIYLFDTSKNN